MEPALTGALFGAGVGLASFVSLRWVAARIEQDGTDAQKKQSAGIIRMVALTDLMLFPIIGYVVGPMVLDR